MQLEEELHAQPVPGISLWFALDHNVDVVVEGFLDVEAQPAHVFLLVTWKVQ